VLLLLLLLLLLLTAARTGRAAGRAPVGVGRPVNYTLCVVFCILYTLYYILYTVYYNYIYIYIYTLRFRPSRPARNVLCLDRLIIWFRSTLLLATSRGLAKSEEPDARRASTIHLVFLTRSICALVGVTHQFNPIVPRQVGNRARAHVAMRSGARPSLHHKPLHSASNDVRHT